MHDMRVIRAIDWVQGYVTAYNMYDEPANLRPDILGGRDLEAVQAFIDDYCAQHPLDSLGESAIALVAELKRKR
jgi:hypothetical protein